jgi:hypothetical protein
MRAPLWDSRRDIAPDTARVRIKRRPRMHQRVIPPHEQGNAVMNREARAAATIA